MRPQKSNQAREPGRWIALCAAALLLVFPAATFAAELAVPYAPPPPHRLPLEILDFKAAVDRALTRNPSIAIAQRDVRRAEGMVSEMRAGWLPSLSASAAYTRLDDERVLGTRVIAARDQLAAGLLLSVPLVAAQRWTQTAHARDDVEIAHLGTSDAERTLAIALARTYIGVVTQRRLVDAAVRALATAIAHKKFALQRFEGGHGNRLDALRAAEEAATAGAQVTAATAQLLRGQEALGVLVGSDVPVDADVGFSLPSTADVSPEAAEDLRSDIKVARRQLSAADQIVNDEWTSYVPSLTGTFVPFLQRPGTPSTPDSGWQAQLLLTFPLFDGGLRAAQRRQHASALEKRRLGLQGIVRQARADMRVAHESAVLSRAAAESAREASQAATEALSLSTFAYKEGATTNIEVVDAERRARDAAARATIADDASLQAQLDVLIATGRFPESHR